jgi:hypothetical protein
MSFRCVPNRLLLHVEYRRYCEKLRPNEFVLIAGNQNKAVRSADCNRLRFQLLDAFRSVFLTLRWVTQPLSNLGKVLAYQFLGAG